MLIDFSPAVYGKVSSTLMRFCVQTHSLNPLSSLHKETIEKLLKSGLLKARRFYRSQIYKNFGAVTKYVQ